jgi:hypothetical protein
MHILHISVARGDMGATVSSMQNWQAYAQHSQPYVSARCASQGGIR